jgi:hypothetical protein
MEMVLSPQKLLCHSPAMRQMSAAFSQPPFTQRRLVEPSGCTERRVALSVFIRVFLRSIEFIVQFYMLNLSFTNPLQTATNNFPAPLADTGFFAPANRNSFSISVKGNRPSNLAFNFVKLTTL